MTCFESVAVIAQPSGCIRAERGTRFFDEHFLFRSPAATTLSFGRPEGGTTRLRPAAIPQFTLQGKGTL